MQNGGAYPGEPVLRITGQYQELPVQTAILGFLCHASGIASATAHIMCEAKGKLFIIVFIPPGGAHPELP